MEHEGGNTILVVNDTPDQLEMMSLLLRQAGYRVLTASDGTEGLQIALRERPQLLISDVMMPRMDGIELCRHIRGVADLRLTPILLVSALRKGTASVVEGLKAGADDYLEAPFDPLHLIAKVPRLVERARSEQALRESEERYRLLVDGVKDYAIFMLDPDGYVVSWNSGAERIKGYEAKEIIGRHVSCFYSAEEIDAGNPGRELKIAEEQGQYEVEGWRVRRDGTRFWANVLVTTLRDDAGRLRGFSKVTRDITERKQSEERLAHEASHDALTGLPNRSLFTEHLRRAIARTKRHEDYLFAVLFLDLDRFKVINDSLGHVIADQLLIAFARKLESILRPEDVMARFGGDEFTILLDDLKDVSDPIRVANRINRELAASFNLGGQEVFTTASIGITFSNQGCNQPEDCLRDADIAMYRAKAQGRARYEIFDQSMHASVSALLQLETDLRRAIDRQEFCLHYQPIIALETGHLTGFEALARWRHPERGLLSPAEFISVAEETGLIIPIGEQILYEACRQTQTWHSQYNVTPPLAVSVNLSSKQLMQPGLVEQINDTLHATGLDPRNLKLEMTESVVMENAGTAIATLSQLREVGVELHIDDFGTGYSSLSYLHRFPVNALKIDRSFVSRMSAQGRDAEIVRTIIQLAHNLHMEVMAEGVETAEQLANLRSLRCPYGQGFYFSAPVDDEAARTLILQRAAGAAA